MPPTPRTTYRFHPDTQAEVAALAASAGTSSQAIREAVHYFAAAVRAAGEANAAEFDADDWTRLAHLNRPDPPTWDDDGRRDVARMWGPYLALELAGQWEGKDALAALPGHKLERAACLKLAKRVGVLDLIHGYAMYSALRYFWADPERELPAEWWTPGVWMSQQS
jgi:hypothetical protein